MCFLHLQSSMACSWRTNRLISRPLHVHPRWADDSQGQMEADLLPLTPWTWPQGLTLGPSPVCMTSGDIPVVRQAKETSTSLSTPNKE